MPRTWCVGWLQEYYANTGALQKAAATARGGKAPGVSIVEAFGKEVKPRELKDVLRIEYRWVGGARTVRTEGRAARRAQVSGCGKSCVAAFVQSACEGEGQSCAG